MAIGTFADMMIGAWGAMLVGMLAGAISVLGYKFLNVRVILRIQRTGMLQTMVQRNSTLVGAFVVIVSKFLNVSLNHWIQMKILVFTIRVVNFSTLGRNMHIAVML